jgi:oligopeptide/dipeptide ABC transporter ATP-binding protein
VTMSADSATRAGEPPLLSVKGLRVEIATSSQPAHVLNGVDLDVRRGEILGVVGESGSGKSMLASSIMRLLPTDRGRITSGSIMFRGEDLVGLTQDEMRRIRGRHLAIIPQDPMTSLNPLFSVGNQIVESVRRCGPHSKQRAFEIACDLLRQVKISDPERRMNSFPHQLSGGMRQRVVGAMAMAGEPRLLIADEPTTSLDATIQLQYLNLIQDIRNATGAAVIFITHDFGVVARICDRVAVMYAGRVVETADVGDLFSATGHPYTQALINSVPSVTAKVAEISAIRGKPPSADAIPSGCAFHPRCPQVLDQCADQEPPYFTLSRTHSSRCWLHEQKGAQDRG